MSFRIKLLSFILVQSLLLIGCSGSNSDSTSTFAGGGEGDFDGGGTTEPSEGTEGSEEEAGSTSIYSYYSLSVNEASKDFSGFAADGLYQGEGATPFIDVFLINPIVASSLAATNLATVNDYQYTIDGLESDPTESLPILQKVIGTPVALKTALVFDVSGSLNDVDFTALIAEAKTYVTTAQASTDSLIANQQYVVWAFGKFIVELTGGFTSDVDAINTALDLVVERRKDTLLNNAGTLGGQSNLHRAIVETIGRYQDDTYDFRDSTTIADDNNDLIDFALSNGIELSQLVLFSSGADTFLEMEQSLMIKAIQSQGFSKFEVSAQTFTSKPIFYYVTGGASQGVAYPELSAESETTEHLTLSGGAYNFADGLIQNQLAAVETRIDLDNQYVYRAAFLPRVGDHSVIFLAGSTVNQASLNYSIKDEDLAPFWFVGTPGEVLESIVFDIDGDVESNGLVEITGANGEYLSNYSASLAEVSTFLPATRWVNDEYAVDDYVWSFPSGDGTGTLNANGSYTVNSITGATAALQLENTVLGYTTRITISN